MACFIVPAVEAVITTTATKIIEKRENEGHPVHIGDATKERFSAKLKRLNHLLAGGSALLAFEHVWHGEVQPFAPFLTAASNPADLSDMLHEMSTVGVGMAVLVTCVWGVATYVTYKIENREDSRETATV